MKFLRVSWRKNGRFFLCGDFLSHVLGECLSRCHNSNKTYLLLKNSWLRVCSRITTIKDNNILHSFNDINGNLNIFTESEKIET